MLRYFGYILIVVTAVGLTAAISVILIGGLVAHVAPRQTVRLFCFDAVGAVNQGPARLSALFEDVDHNQPIPRVKLVFRFENGWTADGLTSGSGAAVLVGPPRPAGRYGFTVSLPDTDPRLDVQAGASLWIGAGDRPVLWVDAAALVAGPAASEGPPPAEIEGIREAMKALAAGRQVVYVVAAEAEDYVRIRRHLEAGPLPSGPAFWIKPGREVDRLSALRKVWPRAQAAVVSSPALEAAAKRLKMSAWRVSDAEAARADPAEAVRLWRNALGRLIEPQGVDGREEP
jgi:hypothetical protein